MRVAVRVYAGLWAATALGAGLAAVGGPALLRVGTLRDALSPTLTTAVDLFGHNCVVAAWPLALVTVGWAGLRTAGVAVDILVATQVAVHGLLVGGAIGQRPELWRYLPHLPFEWLGIAVPAACWRLHRRGGGSSRATGASTAVSFSALLVAAALETWAVPL